MIEQLEVIDAGLNQTVPTGQREVLEANGPLVNVHAWDVTVQWHHTRATGTKGPIGFYWTTPQEDKTVFKVIGSLRGKQDPRFQVDAVYYKSGQIPPDSVTTRNIVSLKKAICDQIALEHDVRVFTFASDLFCWE